MFLKIFNLCIWTIFGLMMFAKMRRKEQPYWHEFWIVYGLFMLIYSTLEG